MPPRGDKWKDTQWDCTTESLNVNQIKKSKI